MQHNQMIAVKKNLCENCGKLADITVQDCHLCAECIARAIEDANVMPRLIRPLIVPALKKNIRTHPEVHAIHPSTFTGLFPPTTGGLM